MSRRIIALLASALAIAGCGLSPDAAPRDLPADERTLVPAQAATGSQAEGPDRIYLGAPGEERLLRSVPRDAVSRQDLIEILFAGPNEDELDQQYTTFLPANLELLDTFKQGTILFLDVSDELTELTGQPLSRALAQIVYTAAELDGVERVQITVDGNPVSWPRPVGGNTASTLSIYDYPNFAQSSQPAFPGLPSGA
ncbi:MAG: GerMN domain-containing protein [Ilumatobacteraceae bacterium]|nr:GerMN domain-containing protein [Ilumatobacteraceae bacterium]